MARKTRKRERRRKKRKRVVSRRQKGKSDIIIRTIKTRKSQKPIRESIRTRLERIITIIKKDRRT